MLKAMQLFQAVSKLFEQDDYDVIEIDLGEDDDPDMVQSFRVSVSRRNPRVGERDKVYWAVSYSIRDAKLTVRPFSLYGLGEALHPLVEQKIVGLRNRTFATRAEKIAAKEYVEQEFQVILSEFEASIRKGDKKSISLKTEDVLALIKSTEKP